MKIDRKREGISNTAIEALIQKKAYELGFENCGIVPLDQLSGYGEMLGERMTNVPESAAFYRRQRRLADPSAEFPWAKSVIVAAVPYGNYHVPEEVKSRIGKSYLFDIRVDENAREFQNNRKMEVFLEELGIRAETNRKFGVVGLRWAAQIAGLGVVRRNNFLYTESGSWLHLEGWLIDIKVEQKEHAEHRKCPEGCRKCIDACPTGSLSQPYTMSPTSCISFLTTFGGRDIPSLFQGSKDFGNCIYGCDICQDVCPMNRGTWNEKEEFPGLNEIAASLLPENIILMEESFYKKNIQPKFFYLQPDELWKWKVDTLCYMRNNYCEDYRSLMIEACSDPHEKVREMAALICDELLVVH